MTAAAAVAGHETNTRHTSKPSAPRPMNCDVYNDNDDCDDRSVVCATTGENNEYTISDYTERQKK